MKGRLVGWAVGMAAACGIVLGFHVTGIGLSACIGFLAGSVGYAYGTMWDAGA